MYTKNSQYGTKHIDFIILDLICVNLAFILTHFLRVGFSNPYSGLLNVRHIIMLTVLDAFLIFAYNTMKNVLKRGTYEELAKTVKHTVLLLLLYVLYLFMIHEAEQSSRISTFIMMAVYCVLSYGVRIGWKSHLLKRNEGEGTKRSMLIVTEFNRMDEVTANIRDNKYEQFRVAGLAVIDENLTGQSVGGYEVVADEASLLDYVCREWIDEVFICVGGRDAYVDALVNNLTMAGVVSHVVIVGVSTEQRQFVEKLGSYTVLTTSINYASPYELALKRLLDIIGGLAGTAVTGLIAIIIGPLIYRESPGPIFFSQERVGKNGKHFKMYKFRSMYLDAEERKKELMAQNRVKDGMMFKLDWDPRIIGNKVMEDGTRKEGIGSFIRKTSLDEFPQFINVLKGDMSLVGTRPPTVDEWEKYKLHHRARLAAKPGITGMWQVSGRSDITDFEEVVRLDTRYITDWTPGLDLKILLRTVLVVFKKEGSM